MQLKRHPRLALVVLLGSLLSPAVFAEPPIQTGDTLESLSQAKIEIRVNDQPTSLQELLDSGQIRLATPPQGELEQITDHQPQQQPEPSSKPDPTQDNPSILPETTTPDISEGQQTERLNILPSAPPVLSHTNASDTAS